MSREEFERIVASFHELREQAAVALKALLIELIASDEEGPRGLRWAQYNPTFNDGDICEFTLSEYTEALSNEDDLASQFSPNEDGFDGQASRLVSLVHREVLYRLFGNRVEVGLFDGQFSTIPFKPEY